MEDSVKTMTKFYRPLVDKSLQLSEISRRDISEAEEEIKLGTDRHAKAIPIGIADGAKRNNEFKQVLDLFKAMPLSNIDIVKRFEAKY